MTASTPITEEDRVPYNDVTSLWDDVDDLRVAVRDYGTQLGTLAKLAPEISDWDAQNAAARQVAALWPKADRCARRSLHAMHSKMDRAWDEIERTIWLIGRQDDQHLREATERLAIDMVTAADHLSRASVEVLRALAVETITHLSPEALAPLIKEGTPTAISMLSGYIGVAHVPTTCRQFDVAEIRFDGVCRQIDFFYLPLASELAAKSESDR